ncbi:hypothetical protein E3Q17_02884 [Wallemia mellicola]|uniref:DUF323 domain-containing protein n=1 Tax=Wallemia mellicola TaxID=1708541 RepID=A0A4T0P453_9BASI|nr:hypothetical protein E3Q17_02884 [Wallemia mellicola]TIC04902.1 hypothetical protein E3Q16_02488 [Wallemia mellicola]TIC17146.1 hypothetical protein E3Q13_02626 [Wallemia mellicola]TIC54908.1 hypothetical protein E3Q04_02095 [Wallemia mellicola]TIC65003.1 hypothetical protein E3Q02_02394 [Wallemia mellicola]
MADTADHLTVLTMNIYNLSTELEIDPNYSVKSLAQCLDSSKDKINPESTSLPYTKTIPTLLLYDNKGLQIYDKITQEILRDNKDEIARKLFNNCNAGTVIELGAGSLRKTSHLLSAMGNLNKTKNESGDVNYFALDLDRDELERTLDEMREQKLDNGVNLAGLCGTYDMGFNWLSSKLKSDTNSSTPSIDRKESIVSMSDFDPSPPRKSSLPTPPSSPGLTGDTNVGVLGDDRGPLSFWHLGSSIGNFDRTSAVSFLQTVRDSMRPGYDTLLIGLDGRNQAPIVKRAYDDEYGVTESFILNGLSHASRILAPYNDNNEQLLEGKFRYVSVYDEDKGRHEAYYKSLEDFTINVPIVNAFNEITNGVKEIDIAKDELLNVEWSYKYSDEETIALFKAAGLRVTYKWTDSEKMYGLWLVERPPFNLLPPNLPMWASTTRHSLQGVPLIDDWLEMWKCWDCIMKMVPSDMLHRKPIDLRHIVLFYFGHIPAFLDIYISRQFGEALTNEHFKDIFERGIDPSMDDPNVCHDHSAVPENEDEWPTLEEVLEFDMKTRERLLNIYADIDLGKLHLDRRLARVLHMTYEHMIMHGETLLYMLIQKCEEINPPSGFSIPDWTALKSLWDVKAEERNQVLEFASQDVLLGHNDSESGDFDAGNKNADSHEYGWDCENPCNRVHVEGFKVDALPIRNGEYKEWLQKTGNNHLPASWALSDGEIKIRTLYGLVDFVIGQSWPVQDSLEQLEKFAVDKGGRIPTEAELKVLSNTIGNDHAGANVSFANWHPIPPAAPSETGKGHNGGVWEWSSNTFEKLEGYEASNLYPGYSSDFYDGAHYVVSGASYATAGRIAERSSFRNWYQKP